MCSLLVEIFQYRTSCIFVFSESCHTQQRIQCSSWLNLFCGNTFLRFCLSFNGLCSNKLFIDLSTHIAYTHRTHKKCQHDTALSYVVFTCIVFVSIMSISQCFSNWRSQSIYSAVFQFKMGVLNYRLKISSPLEICELNFKSTAIF